MQIETGNAGDIETRKTGWLVGFGEWVKSDGESLRYLPEKARSETLCIKWMSHRKGDPGGTGKPISVGRTISFLVSETGAFRVEFSKREDFPEEGTRTELLKRHGDFVIWGEGIYHRWFADEDSVILTVRWIPLDGE